MKLESLNFGSFTKYCSAIHDNIENLISVISATQTEFGLATAVIIFFHKNYILIDPSIFEGIQLFKN